MVIVFCYYYRSTNSKSVRNNNQVINNQINSYEYSYVDDKNVIYGKAYGDKHLFYLSNHKYYYDGKDVYLVNDFDLTKESNFDIGYLKITPQMINDLTENLDYSMNGDAFVYNVPLANFMNLFFIDVPVNLDEVSQFKVVISKYYLNDKLCMVKLDLSDYYSYFKKENMGILTIDFYEQNKVNNFSLEYDGMIGVIK